jgi:cytidylate kinase
LIVVLAADVTYNLESFAKKLAISLGAVYKQLDDEYLLKNTGFFEEQKQGKIVFIGHVIASKLQVPCFKIYLKESKENILSRLVKDEKLSLEDANEKYLKIFKEQKEKMNMYYGIDINNLDVYDLIMKIDNLDQKSIINIIEKFIAKQFRE